MDNRPNSPIFSIVEKAYFRLQAGDVLTHCIEDSSTEPIKTMIQEMVLAGPQSLEALREILGEAIKRKSQVYDDLNQVINQLSIILESYGINLKIQGGNKVLQNLTEQQILKLMDQQGINEKETRLNSQQVVKDSQELITTLNGKIQLLESIENYLQDWLWGLTYQFIRQSQNEEGQRSITNDLL